MTQGMRRVSAAVTESEYEAALVLTGLSPTHVAREMEQFRRAEAMSEQRQASTNAGNAAMATLARTAGNAVTANQEVRGNTQKSVSAVQQALKATAITQTELLIGMAQLQSAEALREHEEQMAALVQRQVFLDAWRTEVTRRAAAMTARVSLIQGQAARHQQVAQLNVFPQYGGPGY